MADEVVSWPAAKKITDCATASIIDSLSGSDATIMAYIRFLVECWCLFSFVILARKLWNVARTLRKMFKDIFQDTFIALILFFYVCISYYTY